MLFARARSVMAFVARAEAGPTTLAEGSLYQGLRLSMATRMPVASSRTLPLGRARMASGGRIRSVRMLTEVDLPPSLVDTEVVWTSWSPT